MPDPHTPDDPRSLWREQPPEPTPVLSSRILARRTRALSASTRSEIVTSLSAGAFFLAILAWRFELRSQPYVVAGAVLMLCWILITLLRFRKQIWPEHDPQTTAVASPAVQFYRAELQRRRDHLLSAWIWSGPLVLACITLAVILMKNGMPDTRRLFSILPLLLLLSVWTAIGIWRRRRLALQIQSEIDEIAAQQ
jgi:hypothetical protein